MDNDHADLENALYQLQKSVDKQNELQEQANGIMRGLVGALEETGQAIADLREEMSKRSS
ncbi:MAG: hypothetical protein Q8M18_10925 [Bradyrhizobium sp.]|nr:hypothetical protein [Bradyrhizobium sp.]